MMRSHLIRRYLVASQKIEGDRLRAFGVGGLSPMASNQTEKGRRRNQRITLVRVK